MTNPLYWLVTITDRRSTDAFLALYESYGVRVSLRTVGAGTAVQEYAAPAGERAVIDYLEGTWEGEEYIPVSLTLQATPFADSDSTSEAQLALTDSLCCGEGVHYVLLARLERRAAGQAARLLCENEALQAMVSGAAQAGPKPAAHSLRVAAGGSLCA